MVSSTVADTQRREDLALIAPHFDEGHYRAQGPDLEAAGGDPLLHFLLLGWREGLDPGPAFDTGFYLATYPDVAQAGLNPLVHYLRWGAWAGCLPRRRPRGRERVAPGPDTPGWTPVLPSEAQMAEARALAAGHFDAAHYLAQEPDLGPAGGDALLHYLVWGWRRGLSPCPPETFDAAFYGEAYPDVAATDASPLLHYLRWGAWAGCLPRRRPPGRERVAPGPDIPGWVPALPSEAQMAEARTLVAGHFDAAYYCAQGPDLARAGGDPLLHFLVWGWRQGLNPGPGFDVAYYLDAYPEVAATDVNPLLHYLRYGIHRDMLPRRPANLWRSQLDLAQSGGERAARIEPPDAAPSLDGAALAGALAGRAGTEGLAVVLSHDGILRSVGGVKNVLDDETAGFREAGWGHLHVAPLRIALVLGDDLPAEAVQVELCLDGRPLGTARVADLLEAVGAMRARGLAMRVVVHHFAGHAPEHVLALVRAAGTAPPVVWLHDFFTLCTSYALMRNDIVFCGAPPADSAGCVICCYGEERARHLRRLRAFFAESLPDVLAPSEGALDLWRRNGFDHARAAAVPLVRLHRQAPEARPPRAPETPIRVAHLGTPSYLKGWAAFDSLVARHGGGGRYAFFQFGLLEGLLPSGPVERVPVRVEAGNRDAMARAVAEHAIDVVLLWSLCRETFSFTVHEALAGGAFVVAREAAGNVWPAILANAPDQGCALEDEAALMALFEGDDLRELLARPRSGGRLEPGRGSVEWLRASGAIRG